MSYVYFSTCSSFSWLAVVNVTLKELSMMMRTLKYEEGRTSIVTQCWIAPSTPSTNYKALCSMGRYSFTISRRIVTFATMLKDEDWRCWSKSVYLLDTIGLNTFMTKITIDCSNLDGIHDSRYIYLYIYMADILLVPFNPTGVKGPKVKSISEMNYKFSSIL